MSKYAIFKLEIKKQLTQLDCPTRWRSTFKLIDALSKTKDVLCNIETIDNKTEDESFNANFAMWDLSIVTHKL